MKRTLLIFAVLTPFFAGCASVGGVREDVSRSSYEDGATFIELASGEGLSAEVAFERLADHRHIYVGEHHGDPVSHRAQLLVLEGLRVRGVSVVVGVEWLPASVQLLSLIHI